MDRMETSKHSSAWLNYSNLIVGVCTLITCVAILTFVGVILEDLIPEKALDTDLITQKYGLSLDDFRPEPIERIQYIVSVFLFLPLCTGFYWVYKNSLVHLSHIWLWRIYHFGSLVLPIAGIELVWGAMKRVDLPFFHTAGIIQFPLYTIAGAVILWGVLQVRKWLPKHWHLLRLFQDILFFGIGFGMIYLLIAAGIFNEADPWVSKVHFQAYYDAVVQAFLGKTVLVDLHSQYGLYPLFLAPIFRLMHPPTVFAFTLLIAILTAIGYACLLAFLRLAVRSKVIAFICFLTLAYYTRFGSTAYFGSEPYFQYIPHRTIFPMLFVLLAWVFLSAKREKIRTLFYYLNTITAILAIYWNMDTGVVVLGAWCFLLVIQECLSIKTRGLRQVIGAITRHGLVILALILVSLVTISIYLYCLSGNWPAWEQLSQYSDLFYLLGFYMIPMPGLIYPWILLIMIYMVALYQVIRFIFDINQKEPLIQGSDEKNRHVIYGVLAVLGVGLFTYYQGRSAEENLIGISWPAFLLLGFKTDNLLYGLKAKFAQKPVPPTTLIENAGNAFLFGCLFLFMFGSIVSILDAFPDYSKIASQRQRDIQAGIPASLDRKIDFIKSNSAPTDQILILSKDASVLYLYSGYSRPLPIAGFDELILLSDYHQIDQFLSQPPENAKVYFDTSFDRFMPSNYPKLSEDKTLPGDGLILYVPNS